MAEYQLNGYSLFSCERSNRPGGGVLLYVKNCLHPSLVKKDNINNIDTTVIQVKNRSRKITIGVVYRPPRSSAEADEKLYDLITDITCQSDSVLFGDFNLPVVRWGAPLTAHSGRDLYNNLQDSALHQHVNNPTRGANILDIILTTSENLVNNVVVEPEFSSSDHRIVTFDIKISEDKVNESNEKIPDFRRADFNKLRSLLANVNWNESLTSHNIEESWKLFTDILDSTVKSCVPFKNRRSSKK